MKVKAVIGGNYGDEGKGLMTDYLARTEKNPFVIRFNGGAQAGHTVSDGRIRHVFSHFGSGTLAGAPTYLAKEFVVNPFLFVKERKELMDKGFVWNGNRRPKIFVDINCRVTTPYDMLINQMLEDSRGKNRHGSVGLGFGETIEQSERFENALKFDDLYDHPDAIYDRLVDIEVEWFRPRLEELGLKNEHTLPFFKEIRRRFVEDVMKMRNWVDGATLSDLVEKKYTLIFEGAQGLLLDQNGEDFPHVTRSNTGLQNVEEILEEVIQSFGLSDVGIDAEVFYMTRSYMTRHGAGPLENEVDRPMDMGYHVVDHTNGTGNYQGDMRFAPLDLHKFFKRTDSDFISYGWRFSKKSIVVTCMDHLEKAIVQRAGNGHVVSTPRNNFVDELIEYSDYISMGPTYRDVISTRNLDKLRNLWK